MVRGVPAFVAIRYVLLGILLTVAAVWAARAMASPPSRRRFSIVMAVWALALAVVIVLSFIFLP